MIIARAPGKLMLAGEYAVAEGLCDALAVATDRLVTVRLEPGGSELLISAPALGLLRVAPEAVPVVQAALEAADFDGPAHLTIESELGSGAQKPGLGASAAICVATFGAARAAMGLAPPTVAEAVGAHRAAQAGRGSGYDVATALLGGVCRYTPRTGATQRLGLPDGLHLAVLTTGRGASTTRLLDALARARRRDPAGIGRQLGAHARASMALVEAWAKAADGDVAAVLQAARAAEASLLQLDRLAEVGIAAGGTAELRRAIEEVGGTARTSGAGGGDSIWALAADADTLRRAVTLAGVRGYARLPLVLGGPGLRVEHERAPRAANGGGSTC